MIVTAILKLVWFIFIQGPLNIIAAFNVVLQYLTGGIINDMLFGSSKEFQWNNIPMQFWWFVLFAFCLFSLIFAIQVIILIFQETVETKTKLVLALQNGLKAVIFMFLIPIFFFLANYIIQNIANTIINNFGANGNLADYLWHMGDPNWEGSPDGVPDGYGAPSNISQYNLFAQIFGTWFMLFAIFIIGIVLVQKIFELFFLFIISPIVMIVMIVDNGKAAFTWKDMVIAKFLAATGTLTGYYIFISAIQVLISSNLNGLNIVPIAKSLFIILALCGGTLATTAFTDMIAALIGESIGIREGMASMKSTMSGGMMAMGAAKMTGKALGFMKSKGAKNSKPDGEASTSSSKTDASDEASAVNFTTFRNATTGMASRSGIVGLGGIATGIIGASVGYMIAGTRKSWKSGNRKGFKAKTKGVDSIIDKTITAPVVHPTKAIGRGLKNTKKTIGGSGKAAKTKNLEKHQKLLKAKQTKHDDKIKKIDDKINKNDHSKEKINQLEAKKKIHQDISNKWQKKHDNQGYKSKTDSKPKKDEKELLEKNTSE